MNAKTKRTFSVIANTILWLFVIFAVIITAMVLSSSNNENGVASIGNKNYITIQSDSMKPAFQSGDLIVIKSLIGAEKAECKVDDVITYRVDLDGDGIKELNTHRIADVYEENGYTYYRTRGDNADKDDNPETTAPVDKDPVVFSDVIGVWTGTRYAHVGSVISFLQSSTGFLVAIVLPLALFFLFELYRFIRAISGMRGKSTALSAEEEEEIKRKAIEEYIKSTQNAPGEKPADPETVPAETEAEPETETESAGETEETIKTEETE